MKEIIVASTNSGKIREIKAMLDQIGIEVKSVKDVLGYNPDIEETGTTFVENALIKAETVMKLVNRPVLADDSGMEVEALPNELGLHTARFQPELPQVERNKLVVKLLENATTRNAKFVCCAVLLVNGKEYKYLHETHGSISNELKGTGGFGYNPIFIPKGYKETYAELSDEEKYKVSHRGVAMRELVKLVLEAGEEL